MDALSRGGITVNEFRGQVGLASQGPAGDVYLRGIAVVEVPAKRKNLTPNPFPEGKGSRKDLDVPGNAPDDEERLKAEREMAGKMKTYLKGQKKRLMEGLATDETG
jgi:hypothetical protein